MDESALHASGDDDDLTGDMAGERVGGEHDDLRGDVLGRATLRSGIVVVIRAHLGRRREGRASSARLGPARRDRVHARGRSRSARPRSSARAGGRPESPTSPPRSRRGPPRRRCPPSSRRGRASPCPVRSTSRRNPRAVEERRREVRAQRLLPALEREAPIPARRRAARPRRPRHTRRRYRARRAPPRTAGRRPLRP